MLVDNLYQSSLMADKNYKIASLNALCNHFQEANDKSNNPRYSCYVVIHGKKTGVFCSWPNVMEAINNTANPKWSGFNNKYEAFEYARKNIGVNYYIDPALIPDRPQFNIPNNEVILCKNCNKLREQVLLGNEYSSLVKQENERLRKENEELQKYAERMDNIVKELDERYNELEESYDKYKRLSITSQGSPSSSKDVILNIIKEEFKQQQEVISQTLQKEFASYFPEDNQKEEDDSASMEVSLNNFMDKIEKELSNDVKMTKE